MVIPVHDDNPVRRRPVVTYAIILAAFVVFLNEPVSGLGPPRNTCQQQAFFAEYAAIPRELVRNQPPTLVPTGQVGQDPASGQLGCVVAPPAYHKIPVLSVLYAMFLHGGWLHLLGNMLFLWVFGNNVEDRLGRLRFLAFYLGCGYVATYVYALFYASSTETLVGASGAIAGVLGAYLVLYPRARVTSVFPPLFFLPFRLPAWVVLGGWFVLQYVYFRGAGLAGGAGVAYLAHLAGFITGALVALPLRGRRPPPAAQPPVWRYGY